jgi:hypothetical protein
MKSILKLIKKYFVFCILFFLFLFINYFFISISIKEKMEEKYSDYHILCARYNKPVDFLNEINIPFTILQKGNAENEIPNIANEATSYLHFIINNYDNLPENMIFIQDENESWHHDGKITEKIYEWINEYEKQGKTYYEVNNQTISYSYILSEYNKSKAFQELWDSIMKPRLGDIPVDGNVKCCAQFIVSKKTVLRHPKTFYENLYNWYIQKTNGEGNGDESDIYSGYYTGRYAEWTWKFIFT